MASGVPDRDVSLTLHSIGGKKKRKDDDEGGDVTYINERNKVFNKKIARYFDKYTKEWVRSLCTMLTRAGSRPVSSAALRFEVRMYIPRPQHVSRLSVSGVVTTNRPWGASCAAAHCPLCHAVACPSTMESLTHRPMLVHQDHKYAYVPLGPISTFHRSGSCSSPAAALVSVVHNLGPFLTFGSILA